MSDNEDRYGEDVNNIICEFELTCKEMAAALNWYATSDPESRLTILTAYENDRRGGSNG